MSTHESPTQREWDLVIYGATGDAGMAIATYVSNHIDSYDPNRHRGQSESGSDAPAPPSVFRWAIAGRSEAKLNRLRSGIIVGRSKAPLRGDEIGVLVADAGSPSELGDLARSARLVLSAAGPYTALGAALYGACVQHGTHYADITGEVDWVGNMRTLHAKTAGETGATLCSFAGYDSVPSDLSLYAARRALAECDAIDHPGGTEPRGDTAAEASLSSAETIVLLEGGAFPRGTLRTMISKLHDGRSFCNGLLRFASPGGGVHKNTAVAMIRWLLPRWSPDYGAFTLPHFMGWCNIPVAYNSSSSCIDCAYHDRFAIPYSKGCMATGYGLLQTLVVYSFLLATAPFGLFFQVFVALVPSTSALLLMVFDSLNYRGNTQRNQKHLDESTCSFWTYATSACSGSKATVYLHVKGDAGIRCTALFAVETAFSMLELDDAGRLPKGTIGSPSMIAGDALVDRLQDEDAIGSLCTFTVEVSDGDDGGSTKKED